MSRNKSDDFVVVVETTKSNLMQSSIYWEAQKSKPLPNYKKLCYVVLKSANEVRFRRQIKEMVKHYNIIRRYYIFSA